MLVLAIDTSTPTVTAGVVRVTPPHEMLDATPETPVLTRLPCTVLTRLPCTVLAERSVTDPFGHAEHLMPLVTSALGEAGCRIGEVQAVAVGIGPGPFTGLRVGMVTAAALGDALGIGVHGVPSHDAVAGRAARAGSAGDFLVVTDARRREVYLSAYAGSNDAGSIARLHGPVVIAPAGVPDLLVAHDLHPGWITGAGAHLLADVLDLPVREPSAALSEFLVGRAARQLVTGVVPGLLTPLYLRRPDATEPSAPKRVLAPAVDLPPTGQVGTAGAVRRGQGDR